MNQTVPAIITGYIHLYRRHSKGWHKKEIGKYPDLPDCVYLDLGSIWLNANNMLPHREHDLPAFIADDGYREWRINGVLHRGGDMPAIINPNGTIEFWEHGKFISRLSVKDNPTLKKLYEVIP